MSMLQTAGTHSCATIAIGSFKGDNYERNEKYKATKEVIRKKMSGLDVENFCNDILYPTKQDLGRTDDFPFEYLMDEIAKHLSDKLITVTLNESQRYEHDGYWPKEFKRHGFVEVDRVNNEWGQTCSLYIKNPRRPKQMKPIIWE